jgi:hypothetical protein
MRNIKLKVLIPAFLVIGLLTILTLFSAWANEEGTLGNNILEFLGAKLFNIFRFPTHVMFWNACDSSILFFLGLMINSLFYALIIERLIYLIIKVKKLK